MALEMKWFDVNHDSYYIGGAVFDDFDAAKERDKLNSLLKEENPIFVVFSEMDNMLLIKEFTSTEPEIELYYVLDEALIEFLKAYESKEDTIFMTAIIALQYFEFDTLKEIFSLSQEEIDEMEDEDKEVLMGVREEISSMSEEERDMFFEHELFFYEKEDLEEFMQKNS